MEDYMSPYPKFEKAPCQLSKDEGLTQKTLHFLSTALLGSGLLLGMATTTAEAKTGSAPQMSIERRVGSVIVLTPATASNAAKGFLIGHGSHASHASHHSHYSGR